MRVNQRGNCLNLIRLIAAFQVMYGHIVTHLEIKDFTVIYRILGLFQGVPIFFGLSGFLIWFSIDRTKNYKLYLKKRFYRIYPELWVGIIVEITVLLLLYRVTSVREIVFFTFAQGSIFQFWTPESLRGYGCGTPNGSLWTICVLIQFYVLAWMIYKLMRKASSLLWIVCIVAVALLSWACYKLLENIGIALLIKLYNQTVFRYLWIFLIGMALASMFNRVVPILMRTWWIWLISAAIFKYTGLDLSIHFGLGYTTCILISIIGFSYSFGELKLNHDVSYAIYIYHMTVINAFITIGLVHRVVYMIEVVIITLILSILSTLFIGERFIKKT